MASRSVRSWWPDASHQSLQPTCCHGYPLDLPALERTARAALTSASGLAPSVPHLRTEDDTGSSTAALVHRKRLASFEQEHSWAVLPAGTIPALPFTGCSAFPSVTLADLLSRASAESTWPLTLPVAPFRSPEQHRVHRREPELFPPTTRQRGRLPKLEAPSSDRSQSPRPSPKLGTRLPEPPLVPPLCRFGPASNMRSRTAVAR